MRPCQIAHSIVADATDRIVLDGSGIYSVEHTETVADGEGGSIDIWSFILNGGNPLATLGVDSDVEETTANTVA